MKAKLLILFIYCFNSASAQWVLSHSNFNIYEYSNELIDISNKSVKLESKIEGSPYINDAFLPIKFAAFGDKTYNARFNAYNSTMEVIPALGETPILLTKNNKDLEITFSTLNKTYHTYEYFDKEPKVDFFVNVLILDKVSLLKKEQIKLNEEVKAKTPLNISTPKEFIRLDDKFFIKIKNEELRLIPNKTELIRLFPKHEKTISSYFKNKKLKFNSETDLKTLVYFLNLLE
jgi:hypothetical protein